MFIVKTHSAQGGGINVHVFDALLRGSWLGVQPCPAGLSGALNPHALADAVPEVVHLSLTCALSAPPGAHLLFPLFTCCLISGVFN